MTSRELKLIPFLICIFIGISIWFIPTPEGVSDQAWHMFAIFSATICALISTPLPMGASAILALTVLTTTKTLTFQQAFEGFNAPVIWLVVIAFFIANGFMVTGLGNRIAYLFVRLLGKHTLGLSYGMLMSDLILAPGIPSVTARAGGILFPIIKSLAESYESHPNHPSSRKMGAFLILSSFQGCVITSAMFLTAMAANPLIVEIAADFDIKITWFGWALAAFVPGIVSLAVLPCVLFFVYPPEVKHTPKAKEWARQKLKEIGPISQKEYIMLFTFILLLVLWIFGGALGISSVVAAMVGLSILLLTGVLKWKELLKLTNVWETFIWFATLLAMAGHLNKLGFTAWISKTIVLSIYGLPVLTAFFLLVFFYFYSHYFFASSTAHVGAMFAPFLAIAIGIGYSPYSAALILAFASNLYGGLTHYSLSPAPLFYGAGYVPIKTWWAIGFLISIVNIFIWATVGSLWWSFLGI